MSKIKIKNIIKQATAEVPESISGIILDNSIKDKYEAATRPFLYQHVRKEEICIKLCLINIQTDENIVNSLINIPDEEKKEEKDIMEDIETNRAPDFYDLEILLSDFASEVNKSGELLKLKPKFGEGKIFTINQVNYVIFSIITGEQPEKVTETILICTKWIYKTTKCW